jgi:hypothetical protein
MQTGLPICYQLVSNFVNADIIITRLNVMLLSYFQNVLQRIWNEMNTVMIPAKMLYSKENGSMITCKICLPLHLKAHILVHILFFYIDTHHQKLHFAVQTDHSSHTRYQYEVNFYHSYYKLFCSKITKIQLKSLHMNIHNNQSCYRPTGKWKA